ncbi:MAG: AI-2E family transporter [Oceanospirillaceae bacterium]|nr:AI-2E family transporter [Oceanospirillaceae bacterium]MCP5351026.1 AI-2E family transporter [Oceanospirillaceae bacterium]
MVRLIKGWMERYFSDEEALFLLLLLVVGLLIIVSMGHVLAPVIGSVIIAYLLRSPLILLERKGVPHMLAVSIIFGFFMAVCLALLVYVVPAVFTQGSQLFNELPRMVRKGQELLMLLPQRYPDLVSAEQIHTWIDSAAKEAAGLGQWLVSFSLQTLPNLMALLIYAVLVPILVFFFLKDGQSMISWWVSTLPNRRHLIGRVWREMDQQIANYIRGKVLEIIIVGICTYIAFFWLDLRYAALLAILVGLSVVVPYIGAAAVTVPVVLVAYFQFGWGNEFIYLMSVYFVIQALDGNVLVPLLFSEVVNLHPVVIILAVLIFGSMWGFWGVFFAIPLATLIKAVLTAWPKGLQQIKTEAAE